MARPIVARPHLTRAVSARVASALTDEALFDAWRAHCVHGREGGVSSGPYARSTSGATSATTRGRRANRAICSRRSARRGAPRRAEPGARRQIVGMTPAGASRPCGPAAEGPMPSCSGALRRCCASRTACPWSSFRPRPLRRRPRRMARGGEISPGRPCAARGSRRQTGIRRCGAAQRVRGPAHPRGMLRDGRTCAPGSWTVSARALRRAHVDLGGSQVGLVGPASPPSAS